MIKLPLNTSFAHRPCDALQLSAILAHPDASHWLADHYLDIYIHRDYIHEAWNGFLDADTMYTCPFLIQNSISRTFLEGTRISLPELLIDALKDQHYIFCCVNKFYIPHYVEYHKIKIPHHLIVYGYDTEEKIFFIADFIKGKFRQFTCTSSELEDGIRFCNIENLDQYDSYMGVELFKSYLDPIFFVKLNNKIPYEFNRNLLLCSLNRYIEGQPPQGLDYIPYGLRINELAFGLSLLDICKTIIKETNEFDVKPFYLMKMHKQIMEQRLCYLANNKYIHNIDECLFVNSQLMQLYTTLYMLVLKFDMTSWKSIASNKLIDLIQEAEKLEHHNTDAIISHILNDSA